MDTTEYLDFVASIFGVGRGTLSRQTAYSSIPEWDSVMQIRLVMELEAHYGVEIPMEQAANLTTLGAFFDYVAARRPA